MSESMDTNNANGGKFGSGDRFLCFSLGKEEYAVPLLRVREVIAMPEFTPIPHSPPYFLGIMNLRGQVISVLDLRLKMGIKPLNGAETGVIICDFEGVSIGVVVDAINSVLAPSTQDISPKPEIQGSKNADWVSAVYRAQDKLILFLDLAKTLSLEDQAAIARAGAKKSA